jgi:hypothetical protein
VSVLVTLFFISLVYGALVAYIVVKLSVSIAIVDAIPDSESWASLVGVFVGATVNLIAVGALNAVYVCPPPPHPPTRDLLWGHITWV